MADIGTGATFEFVTTGLTLDLTSIEVSGVAREAVDITHLGTTVAKAFIPGDLYDPGEISFEGLLDPQDGDTFPITGASETMRVTFPTPSGLTTPAKFECTGFVTEYEFGVPMEEEMTFSMTIKLTGAITWTDAI
jgi:hypothetical protein